LQICFALGNDMSGNSDEHTTVKARPNKTLICSVLFLDIVAYSQKSVDEQIKLKRRFNSILSTCLKDIPQGDRLILDTGDGAAIGFLSDPEDALFVGMAIQDALNEAQASMPDLRVRLGINLGPVKILKDINNQFNLVGDGINVAQRIMSFAEAGQLLVSRSYFDIVSCLAQEYAQLFEYKGIRADKHVREHDLYAVENRAARPASTAHYTHHRSQIERTATIQLNTIEPVAKTPPAKPEGLRGQMKKKILWIAGAVIAVLVVSGGIFMVSKSPREAPKEAPKATEFKVIDEAPRKAVASKSVKRESKTVKPVEPVSVEKKPEAKEEPRQEIFTASSRVEGMEFAVTGLKANGSDKTIIVRIRNSSNINKSVALYDEYVRWPKSKATDASGKIHEVTKVIFTKGGQTITSKASGSQGVTIGHDESVTVALTFKDIGKSIKSFSLHPFIYVGRSWTEHDLPMKIGR